jgi:D-alanine-D-alanine ligase
MNVKRIRVGVIFGGRSSEHFVSIRSASSVIANLDRERYEPAPLYVFQNGHWAVPDRPPSALTEADAKEYARDQEARQPRAAREAHLVANPSDDHTLLTIERDVPRGDGDVSADPDLAFVRGLHLDVVFPVLHGPYGEDGTVQGLLELANVPYVGAGVLASSVGMDKAVMKVVFAARGLPVPAWTVVSAHEWAGARKTTLARVLSQLQLPLFVKPANLGSSVGISKAKDDAGLAAAIDLAARYDRKVVVEAAVPNAREIEVSVLGNDAPKASVAGEIVPSREFYDYEAKYLDDDSKLLVPAPLTKAQMKEVQRLAVEAFLAVDGAGMGRVDFLLDGQSGAWYVNEINTIPGFTTISMYPKLWEATGLPYAALLEQLIDLAVERHAAKQHLRTSP